MLLDVNPQTSVFVGGFEPTLHSSYTIPSVTCSCASGCSSVRFGRNIPSTSDRVGQATAVSTEPLTSRSACSQSSRSWPCSHPRSQNISNARRAISRSVRPVALSSAGVLDSVAGIAVTLVLVSLRFFAITSSFTTSHLTIVPPRRGVGSAFAHDRPTIEAVRCHVEHGRTTPF